MLTKADLEAPALLAYVAQGEKLDARSHRLERRRGGRHIARSPAPGRHRGTAAGAPRGDPHEIRTGHHAGPAR